MPTGFRDDPGNMQHDDAQHDSSAANMLAALREAQAGLSGPVVRAVGQTIVCIVELVGPEPSILQREPLRLTVVIGRIAAGLFGHRDNSGAQRLKQLYFFRRLGSRYDDDRLIPSRQPDHGQANARIAGGAFDDRVSDFCRSVSVCIMSWACGPSEQTCLESVLGNSLP